MVITDVCLLLLLAVTMIVYPSCPNFLYNFVPSLIISYYIIMPNFCRVFVKMCVQTDSCERDPNSPFKKIDLWCFGIWGQMLKNISIYSNQDCNDSQRGKNLLEVVFSHSKSPNDRLWKYVIKLVEYKTSNIFCPPLWTPTVEFNAK